MQTSMATARAGHVPGTRALIRRPAPRTWRRLVTPSVHAAVGEVDLVAAPFLILDDQRTPTGVQTHALEKRPLHVSLDVRIDFRFIQPADPQPLAGVHLRGH